MTKTPIAMPQANRILPKFSMTISEELDEILKERNVPQEDQRHHYQRNHQQPIRNHESLLLDKLQDMVPIMPRNRALTKLEIINYVIEYIRHLREMVAENQDEEVVVNQESTNTTNTTTTTTTTTGRCCQVDVDAISTHHRLRTGTHNGDSGTAHS